MPHKAACLAAASVLPRAKLLHFFTTSSTRVSFATATTTSRTQTEPPAAHFMIQYLASNCGFSVADAAKYFKHLSHLKSTTKPDAVLRFLRCRLGLDGDSLRNLLSCRPTILTSDVNKTLEPKLAALCGTGFSEAEVSIIVAANPAVLHLRDVRPKFQFLRLYLPSNSDLLKALRRDHTLLGGNLPGSLVPNIALLRAHGVPERDVAHALIAMPWLLSRKASSFRELFDRATAHGFTPSKGMFLYALYVLSRFSKEAFQSKVDMMESFGWSAAEFNVAFRKAPFFAARSDEALRTRMKFLVEEVGLQPGYIAERPLLLMYSLEKRVAPRHQVHQILKAEGLHGSKMDLCSLVNCSEQKFLKNYIVPHLEKVPRLREIYPAACAKEPQF